MASVETTNSTANHQEAVHNLPDHEGGVHFHPPLYRQRYMFALDLIDRDPTLCSLLDIGCGTGQLLTIGKYRNPQIQLVAALDIVRFELEEACFRLKPLPVEYLIYRRETPLHTYIIEGDATKVCSCFHHFDVVTLIEVIEHLHLPDLENLVQHVFASIRARVVIVTTPNADFNVLFPQMSCGQFRHADHKFEFTRDQFNLWAEQIALTHNYLVEFHGVGEAPASEQYRKIGTCTQIAVFYRQEPNVELSLTAKEFFQRLSYCQQHELVAYIDYPHGTKNSADLPDQIRYILDMYRIMAEDKVRHGDDNAETYPLTVSCQSLLSHPRLSNAPISMEGLKLLIEELGYKMLDNDQIILSEEAATSSHSDDQETEQDEHVHSQPSQISEGNDQAAQNAECWD